jgi:threonyl-tRNA synthetase
MKKIRNHRKLQPAYMVILGDGEMENETVSLRARNGDQVADLPLQDFVDRLMVEIETKVSQPALVPAQQE